MTPPTASPLYTEESVNVLRVGPDKTRININLWDQAETRQGQGLIVLLQVLQDVPDWTRREAVR